MLHAGDDRTSITQPGLYVMGKLYRMSQGWNRWTSHQWMPRTNTYLRQGHRPNSLMGMGFHFTFYLFVPVCIVVVQVPWPMCGSEDNLQEWVMEVDLSMRLGNKHIYPLSQAQGVPFQSHRINILTIFTQYVNVPNTIDFFSIKGLTLCSVNFSSIL